MNYSTAVFLINDNCRAIEAIYEADTDSKKAHRTIFKSFDDAIKVGDIIAVPSKTRHHITTCKVTACDIEMDPETTEEIKWVIAVVDTSEYEEMKATEEKAISQIKAAQKTHQREELRKKMFAHMDEQAISALQIANLAQSQLPTSE
jgi:predicted Mrr-cat superfamily restriction endonuclease